ncbi:Glycosyltransferase involved in cell wall bisynthesis [Thermanaeromonas toyohensis ToBE]|uniref:Glycosyltransferase involved in cell wall bisynthesis n=1 Tax=Thermanaeromonas toyohensis ToBE TaxID=698762 RepID=A0A1W1VXX4_9FIRM|nr:glycosyltransferase family 1 protein [Thermanaeromonas toyohensis]SMB98227.1 Glycosyltransferase involved in cell wall bisynthesis [Thermanaeromonas toyohensis ToBE]
MSLKLLLNTTPLLHPLTGIGNYILNLAEQFNLLAPENEYLYFYNGRVSRRLITYETSKPLQQFYRLKEVAKSCLSTIPFVEQVARRSWNLLKTIKKALGRPLDVYQGIDVYFEPNFILLDLPAKKKVVTVHDLSFYLHPEWFVEGVLQFKEVFIKKLGYADRVITGSRTVKEEVCNTLNLPEDRVVSIYNGVDHNRFREYPRDMLMDWAYLNRLPSNFILYVGNIEPRKNLLKVIKAYSLLPPHIKREYKLVLVGFKGWKNREVMEAIASTENVLYIGYVSAQDLPYYYNLASFFVYMSLYEGFGLPPLEAMACGIPVLVSDIPVFREILSDAALYADPLDVEEIASKMTLLIEQADLRSKLVKKGKERAAFFNWEKTATDHLNLFYTLVER